MKRRLVALASFCALVFAFALPAHASETITYTYDALGRLVGQVDNGTVNSNDARTYCYDSAGNRTRVASDQTGVLSTASCPTPVYTTANLWIDDATVTEGGVLSFSVTRSGNTSGTASVSYATSNGSASAPGDYTAVSGTVSFAAGQTTKTVNVSTVDDALYEGAKTVNVTLSNPVGGALVDGSAVGTINDNDAGLAIYLSVASSEVVEGTPLRFVVTRTGNVSAASTVGYYTIDDTAFSGGSAPDYIAVSNTLSFAAGETSKTITVTTANDSFGEFYEDMYLALTSPSPNSFFNNQVATGTIVDDELNAILSVSDASVTEGGTLGFVVTRRGDTSHAASADYLTVDGTALAPGDYTSTSGTVSFAAGETSKTVYVPTVNDTAVESTESMTLSMPTRSMNAYIADGSAVGTIVDNDVAPPANLAIGNASVTEGGQLSFTVTRSGTTTTAVSASYATANGSATAGSDYTSASGTVSFAANQTTATITVNTANDSAVESAETLTVTLSNPSSGAAITTATGTGTINDNDTALAIGNASVTEGGTLSFTVTRSGVTTGTSSASYATANGTATAGSDYTGASGTVSFAANQTTATITVNTTDDATQESAETLTVTLSSPVGATITTATGTGTINDNDLLPANLAIGNASVTEGGQLSFTVTRSGTTTTAVSASYATANGSATAGSDYTSASGTVSFAANQTTATIMVNTTDDSITESAETLTVTLSNPSSGATIATASGTGTINDNDGNIILTTTGAPFHMTVLPQYSSVYGCQGGAPGGPGTDYEVCFVIGVGAVYNTSGAPGFATGYSLTANGELQVDAAHYGTAQ